jgi:hypothetical protein
LIKGTGSREFPLELLKWLLAIGQALAPLRTLIELGTSGEAYRQLMTLPNGLLAAVYGEAALSLSVLRASGGCVHRHAAAKPAFS